MVEQSESPATAGKQQYVTLLPAGRVCGARRNVYLHYPNGVTRSKLTNDYLAAQLQTT